MSLLLDPAAECIAPTCVADYDNGQAPKECLLFWRNSWFSPSFFVRIVPAILEVESDGTSTVDPYQGYRFLGVPADQALGELPAAEFEANAGDTSTGDANQWYEKGREIAGWTPSAATPGTSNHGNYTVGATDCSTNNDSRRIALFPAWGLTTLSGSYPDPDEPWHWQATIDPTHTLPSLNDAIVMAELDCRPVPPPHSNRREYPIYLRNPLGVSALGM